MITEPLYYKDQSLTEFTARVISCEYDPGQKVYRVELDKTLFYPGGGGQPADTGTLSTGSESVSILRIEGNGDRIFHIIPSPVIKGAAVTGRIDDIHRTHYMQQHSGQHILSAVMFREKGIATSSIHLGEPETAVEVELDNPLTEREIEEIEEAANGLIRSSVPFRELYPDKETLSEIELRRSLKTESNIRVVEIDGYDAVGCGGIHCRTTADVKLILFTRQEKIRGNLRTYWLIGDTAVQDLRNKRTIIQQLVELFSAPQDKLVHRVEGFLEKQKNLEYELEQHRKNAARAMADRIKSEGETVSGIRFYHAVLEGIGMTGLRELCNALCSEPDTAAILLSDAGNAKGFWIAGCHPETTFDFDSKKATLLTYINGKGGGKRPQWQGGWNPEAAGAIESRELLKIFST